MKLKDKLIRASFLFIIFFLFIFGLALFGFTYFPYELVKAKIDSFAPDGNASSFTVERFKQIRFIGNAIFFSGGLLYINRRQTFRYLTNALTALYYILRDVVKHFKEAVRKEDKIHLTISRRKVLQYVPNTLNSLISFLREVMQHFKEAVRKEDKIHLYALFLIILIAIAVRLFFLSQPMRIDESRTFVTFAMKPLYIGLTDYSVPNNHLFHTFLVHISYLLFGNQPWVIRLPAFFAGILMVPASYLVIRVFYNKHAALLTAGIVASSSMLIYYSTNARGYTLISLIFLLILALGAYLKENRNSGAWFLFSILSAIGFYTMPIMLYPFGIVMMWLFLSIICQDTNLNRRHLLKDLFVSLIITTLLTLVLYTPVFLISGLEAVISNKFVSPKSFITSIFGFQYSINKVLSGWHRDMPFVIMVLLVIGFLASLVFHKLLSIHRVPIILAVAIWCIPVVIIQRLVPYKRVWLFLLPVYIGLASSGVTYLLKPIVSKISNYRSAIFAVLAIALSSWLGLNVVQTPMHYGKLPIRDAENVTVLLKDYLRPGDIVLPFTRGIRSFFPDPRFEYYFELYGIPSEYLISDLDPQFDLDYISRILVIVRNEYIEELEELTGEISDKKGLSVTDYNVPKLIRRHKDTSLYEMDRLNNMDER
ncbi:MAG: glycosyltransferase family 39 protein [Candidatus Mariimomonas ferrooxydans]